MMKPMNFLAALAAALFLWACGGNSGADGGVSVAQMNAAIAAAITPLQAEISALQSELPHNLIVSHGGVLSASRTYALRPVGDVPSAATVAAPATVLATFLGSPSGSVFGMTQQVGISNSTNYLFIASADGTTANSAGLPVTILYESLNCQGPAFTILVAGLSTANITQGVVFGTGPVGDTTASDYLMLKAGTLPQPDFANSELEATPGSPTCVNISPGPNNYTATYPLVQNDQAVSGIPSGPFAATSLGP